MTNPEQLPKIIYYKLKGYSLSELSINRFVLRDKIEEFIEQILIQHAKKKFNVFANSKKISVRAFDKFPDKISDIKSCFDLIYIVHASLF